MVDDDASITKLVTMCLQSEGFGVDSAALGRDALKQLEDHIYDLVVLDITLPDLDGFQICQSIRETSQVPIIMLSGRQEEGDKVQSLDLGADDYVTKPFGVDEFLARVRAVLRRAQAFSTPSGRLSYKAGDLQVSYVQHQVLLFGQEVELTQTEYNLLSYLTQNAGKPLTHTMLLRSVWGPEYGSEVEYVRVFINRLRSKLQTALPQPWAIETLPGVGYRFHSEKTPSTTPQS